jgi:polyisoprenoid-binding protein YceI
MKRTWLSCFCIVLLPWIIGVTQPLSKGKLVTREAKVSLYAYGSLEPIRGENENLGGTIDLDSNTFQFTIQTREFTFKSKLMERHVHEEYLETAKFPEATFTGRIMQPLMISTDGVYEITAIGDLEVHGVKKSRTINAQITKTNGELSLSSTFTIVFTDHQIKIPTLFFTDYATEVEVSLNSRLLPLATAAPDGKN